MTLNWSLIYLASEWLIRFVMLIYVPQRRSPAAARTWLLLIFLLPWPGLIVYALIGRIYVPRHRLERQARASQHIRAAQAQMRAREPWTHTSLPTQFHQAVTLARRLGDFETFDGNQCELIASYQDSIDRLICDIDAACHHVHLLYYIFEDDETGRRVADALDRAARRGVTCRVLMDAVGSKRALRGLAPKLRASGMEVHALLPVGLFRRNAGRFDLRNHRKIAVIDGCVGHTGSQNIVNAEFVKNYPNEELVVRVTGPVVAQLQAVFLADRYFETGTVLEQADLFPELPPAGRSPAQLLPSGPGYQRENAQELMVALIHGARERVVITTPYFVPDDPFLQALRTAVRCGVEMHVVVSMKSNQLVTNLAQQSYYEELLDAGVNLHLYKPHFLHAKHLSVDQDIALIGSTNIDIRSFALNNEVSLLIYDPEVVAKLRAVQERYFANSRQLTAVEWKARPISVRTIQGIARLADSLL